MYEHRDWPRDLIHKESGKRQEFKTPEDVPPGWLTVDGEEVSPGTVEVLSGQSLSADASGNMKWSEGGDDASEQALRDLRGRGSDAQPRGKGRKRGRVEPVGSDPGVSDVEEPGGGSDG